MAGYSGTPLTRKLGIPSAGRAVFVGAPDHLPDLLGPLPDGLRVLSRPGRDMDYIHLFSLRRLDLEQRLPRLRAALADTGMLWVSWPKKSSGVATDVDEAVVRAAGLASGIVDVKICAVDETWSGLKFMVRRRDRGKAR